MLLEATLHRIGGDDGYPRMFLPRTLQATPYVYERWDIPCADSRYWMPIAVDDWTPVDDDWMSCRITLTDAAGQFFGTRPALFYRQPYDVPTHTLFRPAWPEAGVFSLGLRTIQSDGV